MSYVDPLARKFLIYLVIVVSIIASVQVAFISPAAASWTWCTGFGKVCVATNINGDGSRATLPVTVGACLSVPWNDAISSVKNNFQSSGGQVTFWWDGGCNGNRQTYGPLTTVNNVGWFNNDEWSSYCIGPADQGDSGPNSCRQWFP